MWRSPEAPNRGWSVYSPLDSSARLGGRNGTLLEEPATLHFHLPKNAGNL